MFGAQQSGDVPLAAPYDQGYVATAAAFSVLAPLALYIAYRRAGSKEAWLWYAALLYVAAGVAADLLGASWWVAGPGLVVLVVIVAIVHFKNHHV